jgi:hypothetical protein
MIRKSEHEGCAFPSKDSLALMRETPFEARETLSPPPSVAKGFLQYFAEHNSAMHTSAFVSLDLTGVWYAAAAV